MRGSSNLPARTGRSSLFDVTVNKKKKKKTTSKLTPEGRCVDECACVDQRDREDDRGSDRKGLYCAPDIRGGVDLPARMFSKGNRPRPLTQGFRLKWSCPRARALLTVESRDHQGKGSHQTERSQRRQTKRGATSHRRRPFSKAPQGKKKTFFDKGAGSCKIRENSSKCSSPRSASIFAATFSNETLLRSAIFATRSLNSSTFCIICCLIIKKKKIKKEI